MNTLTRTAALALVAAFSLPALAQTAASPTREEVIAELVRARANGELARMNSEDTAIFGQPVAPAATALAKKDAAKSAPAQAGVPAAPAPAASATSRDAIKAELLRARQAGEMDFAQAELGPRLNEGGTSKLPVDPVLAGHAAPTAR